MSTMAERAQKRAEGRKNHGSFGCVAYPEGVEKFKPEVGKHELDILPYRVKVDNHPNADKGETWYQRTFFVHNNIGPMDEKILCPSTFDKRCPICEEWARLRKDENADKETVDGLKAKERELYNVYDVGQPKLGIQIMEISFWNFGTLLEEHLRSGDLHKAQFSELVGGSTLKVTMSKANSGTTTYPKATIIDFIPREDYAEDTLNDTYDLDAMLVCRTYEEIQKMFLGLDSDDAPPEAPPNRDVRTFDTKPQTPTRPSRPGKASPPVEEPPPAEDTPPPRRSLRRPGAAAQTEETPPARSARPGRKAPEPPPVEEPPPAGEVTDGECPSEHEYGMDCDTQKECTECAVWDDCKDQQDLLAAKATPKTPTRGGFKRKA